MVALLLRMISSGSFVAPHGVRFRRLAQGGKFHIKDFSEIILSSTHLLKSNIGQRESNMGLRLGEDAVPDPWVII